jgi:hypothetical protein
MTAVTRQRRLPSAGSIGATNFDQLDQLSDQKDHGFISSRARGDVTSRRISHFIPSGDSDSSVGIAPRTRVVPSRSLRG